MIDKLLGGDLLQALDILSQRFLAVELASETGCWETASHLELVPRSTEGALEDRSKKFAAEEERRRLKLNKALSGGRGAARK